MKVSAANGRLLPSLMLRDKCRSLLLDVDSAAISQCTSTLERAWLTLGVSYTVSCRSEQWGQRGTAVEKLRGSSKLTCMTPPGFYTIKRKKHIVALTVKT